MKHLARHFNSRPYVSLCKYFGWPNTNGAKNTITLPLKRLSINPRGPGTIPSVSNIAREFSSRMWQLPRSHFSGAIPPLFHWSPPDLESFSPRALRTHCPKRERASRVKWRTGSLWVEYYRVSCALHKINTQRMTPARARVFFDSNNIEYLARCA